MFRLTRAHTCVGAVDYILICIAATPALFVGYGEGLTCELSTNASRLYIDWKSKVSMLYVFSFSYKS